ncbi:hypothetical protein [Wukongibacter sp. M2B1]|uniref:hypothetical protein n=1 Tax=Wukongibacter sp. M2B1 TaxID=3088895 RepID=UPI003D7BAE8D
MRKNESNDTERILDEYFSPQNISLSNSSGIGYNRLLSRDCRVEGNIKKCRGGDSIEY